MLEGGGITFLSVDNRLMKRAPLTVVASRHPTFNELKLPPKRGRGSA